MLITNKGKVKPSKKIDNRVHQELVRVSFSMDKELRDKSKELANKKGLSNSAFMRMLIAEAIEEDEGK